MMLTANDLFTPQQSGVSVNPNVAPADGTWFASLLATASALGLPTTSWQPGAPERTILSIVAVALAQEDSFISAMAQGGLLDYSASGFVSLTAIDGSVTIVPVTADPSIPSQNPTGALGWLDALGASEYSVTRLPATYAAGQLAVANTGAGTFTYTAGTYHASNAVNGATYKNVDAISVPTSAIAGTGGVITGVATGTTTSISTATAHGLSAGDTVYVTGALGTAGLNGSFASVSAVTTTSFSMQLFTSGTWTSGGTVYKCSVVNMVADVIGTTSNAGAGQVTGLLTQNLGTFVSNLAPWSAANYESNTAYAGRCRLKLGTLSPNGPSQAYVYYALSAQSILAAQTPSITLTNGPIAKANTFSTPADGTVITSIASTTPASTVLGSNVTPGVAQMPVSAATFATPIAISTSASHGLSTGDSVTVSGVLGNTAANGGWTITVTGLTSFTLNGSVGTGSYTGGGRVSGGDLGQVDTLIQNNVVPDGVTALTVSATAFPVSVVAVVVVPQVYVATYAPVAIAAVQALFASYPIGGNIPPGSSVGTVPWSAVEGALVEAGATTVGAVSYVRQVTSLTLNGAAVDLAYPSSYAQALLAVPTISVVGV